ncbi:MAG: PilZ domain-containing protein [Desulfobacterota bacterium]|nr:PilZ domain-containing protein [Thermodesulfobacteriota bacterium]
MDQAPEEIQGERLVEMLEEWIGAKRLCRMAIPETDHAWITLILGIETRQVPPCLLVDQVRGGEKIILHHRERGLRFEFLEKDGVLCWFHSRYLQSRDRSFLAEFPSSIFRRQRRRFVRINARSGTEILFQKSNGNMICAHVKDYGLGGVSFLTPPLFNMKLEEPVCEIELRVPDEKGWRRFHIPQAKVKRLERVEGGGGLCILEFIDIPEPEKEHLWHFIFKEQRSQLRKTGKI